MISQVEECNQLSTTACRYRRYIYTVKFAKTPFTQTVPIQIRYGFRSQNHFAVVSIHCPMRERLISRWDSRSYWLSYVSLVALRGSEWGWRGRRRWATELRKFHDAIAETQWQILLYENPAFSQGLQQGWQVDRALWTKRRSTTFLSRYCPRCVCARLNRFFSHLVGWRFALYLKQTCGYRQEQAKTPGSNGAHTAQFGQKLTCQKNIYRAMATGDIRVIDLLVRDTKHSQDSSLDANYCY